MRIPRFYLAETLVSGQQLALPPELFRHAIQVLKLKPEQQLILFNGDGGEYLCQLLTVEKRKASLEVLAFDAVERESPLSLTLVQSIIKPDKMDFAIQKSVELGISRIQPVSTERSVVRLGRDKIDKKLSHWQSVAISACEQSGRTCVPEVLPILTLIDWLSQTVNNNTQRLMLMPGDYPRINELTVDHFDTQRFEFLIGPEGGLTEQEAETCLQHGIKGISLGSRILRAETAALSVATLLQQRFGDL